MAHGIKKWTLRQIIVPHTDRTIQVLHSYVHHEYQLECQVSLTFEPQICIKLNLPTEFTAGLARGATGEKSHKSAWNWLSRASS